MNKNELNKWANGIGNIDSHHLNQLLQEYVLISYCVILIALMEIL